MAPLLTQLVLICTLPVFGFTSAKAQLFVPVEGGPITDPAQPSMGASWGDFDGDGDLDVFIANPLGTDQLIRNEGNGEFVLHTGVPFGTHRTTTGGVWGDFDNDGDLDLFRHTLSGGSELFLNQGDGTFVVIPTVMGATVDTRDASAADYDNDGRLDVLLVNRFGTSNQLFQNTGVGFVRSDALESDVSDSVSGAWNDFDNDGYQDLVIVNTSGGVNRLYRNQSGVLVLVEPGLPEEVASWHSPSWGDYNNDGNVDLFIASASGHDALYENYGFGLEHAEAGAITARPASTRGSAWGDVDNDGDLDLVVTGEDGAGILYLDLGGSFVAERITEPGYGLGVSLVDYDNDGDLDLMMTRGDFVANESNVLYRNTTTSAGPYSSLADRHWLHVLCEGTLSNVSAVGARVRVKAAINGVSYWQTRSVETRSGRGTQSGLRVHFGLGDATVVDSITVDWPSGMRDTLVNVPSDQILRVVEGGVRAVNTEEGREERQSFTLSAPYPNPFVQSVRVELTIDRSGPLLAEVYDLLGRRVRTLTEGMVQPGTQILTWDGYEDSGRVAVAGVYVLRARASGYERSVRVLLAD